MALHTVVEQARNDNVLHVRSTMTKEDHCTCFDLQTVAKFCPHNSYSSAMLGARTIPKQEALLSQRDGAMLRVC